MNCIQSTQELFSWYHLSFVIATYPIISLTVSQLPVPLVSLRHIYKRMCRKRVRPIPVPKVMGPKTRVYKNDKSDRTCQPRRRAALAGRVGSVNASQKERLLLR